MRSVLVVCVVLVGLVGCGKQEQAKPGQDYGKACKPGVALVAPWADFALPVTDGRVCSSTELQTEVQYLDKAREDLQAVYEQALTAAGFVKGRCNETTKGITPNCVYEKPATKGGKHEVRVSVRAMPGERQVQVWLKSEGQSFAP